MNRSIRSVNGCPNGAGRAPSSGMWSRIAGTGGDAFHQFPAGPVGSSISAPRWAELHSGRRIPLAEEPTGDRVRDGPGRLWIAVYGSSPGMPFRRIVAEPNGMRAGNSAPER